jgi:hypothetical protein
MARIMSPFRPAFEPDRPVGQDGSGFLNVGRGDG